MRLWLPAHSEQFLVHPAEIHSLLADKVAKRQAQKISQLSIT